VRDVDERNVQRSMISNLSVVKRFDKVDLTSSTSYFTREFEIRDDSSRSSTTSSACRRCIR
jgi:hypothetical protein